MSKSITNTNSRNIFRRLGIVFVLIAFLASCAPSAPTPNPPAYWPTAGWRSTTPEEQGMDSEILANMVEHIQVEKLDLHSLLIVRNGYLVSELYVYPYSAEQAHWVFSVTKSVIGTLVGIAIQGGYIKDVHQTLFSLLPDQGAGNLDEEKKVITLEDLLTMTSGLDCNENREPGKAVMEASPDWVQFMLDQSMVARPGTKFNYCTSSVQLLSAVLQNATGMSARQFANKTLFAPLGIQPALEARWPSDPQGISIGGYGLALTPREMAKLGYLFLNQGQWDGKTVVPADWIATSTTSHANRGDKKEYGYLWWLDPQGKWFAALGRGGQHIFVYPAENLVVVFTAALPYSNDADLIPLQKLLDQYILPAIKTDQPLPANPKGLTRLEAGIQAQAQPERILPQPLPVIATQISGKVYALEENPFGWQTIVFTFPGGADEAKITVNGVVDAPIGLDNLYRTLLGQDDTFPQGFRGRWDNQDIFVIESVTIGQIAHEITQIQFTGNAIHINWQDMTSENRIEVKGTLAPVIK